MADVIARILAYIEILEQKWTALEDRVAVLEDITIDHEGRLEDLENGADEDRYLEDE